MFPEARSETRIVPAIAVPKDEPRLETLRDSPEISPCSCVRHRVELNSTLLWHLHDLWPELQLPGGALFSKKWSTRISRRLARAEQTMRVRIARDELRRLRELTQAVTRLEREITELVGQLAPQLLSEPGFGPRSPPSRRRDRRRPALRHTGQARPRGGRRTDPGQLGQHPAPAARPRRKPPDQRGTAPRDRHPRALSPPDARLHPAPAQRGQEHPRSDPLPQALPRPPRLATAPADHPAQDIHTINFLT